MFALVFFMSSTKSYSKISECEETKELPKVETNLFMHVDFFAGDEELSESVVEGGPLLLV
jgi:hypothetical protein